MWLTTGLLVFVYTVTIQREREDWVVRFQATFGWREGERETFHITWKHEDVTPIQPFPLIKQQQEQFRARA